MTKLGVIKTYNNTFNLSFRSIEKSHNSDNTTPSKLYEISPKKVEMTKLNAEKTKRKKTQSLSLRNIEKSHNSDTTKLWYQKLYRDVFNPYHQFIN